MSSDFEGAIALVTGAASGIGAAVAERIASGGARKLILVDKHETGLRAVAASLPCAHDLLFGDVCDETLWSGADLSGLTHAALNAGIGAASPIADLSFEEWRRVLAVNLDGAFLSLRAAMQAMRNGGAGGAVVLTASAAGLKAEPGIAAYGASKAAVIHLARIAAREGAEAGIRVNAIAPGGVKTAIWEKLPFFEELVRTSGSPAAAFAALAAPATPLGRFAEAREIADQIAFLLSAKAAFVTGTCLVSDGGYSA